MSLLELYPVQVIVFTPLVRPGTKFVDFEDYEHQIDTFRRTNFACSKVIVCTPLTQVPLQFKRLWSRH
jgi:hypothetical protein